MEGLLTILAHESQRWIVIGMGSFLLLLLFSTLVLYLRYQSLESKYEEQGEEQHIKILKIERLQVELGDQQIKNATVEQMLKEYMPLRRELELAESKKDELLEEISLLERRESQLMTGLEHAMKDYEMLRSSYQLLEDEKRKLNDEKINYSSYNASLEMKLEEQERHIDEKLSMMRESKAELKEEFEKLASQVFEGNSQKFAKFSKEGLDNIIQPLHRQIDEFKKQVADVYDKESRDRAVLQREITTLKELNQKISTDAINLTNALKGENKTQGTWGEMVLEHVLEASGLRKGYEFEREPVCHGEEDQIYRPDVIVHLPDSRDLIIDSKTSLVAYERYINSVDALEKERYLQAHIVSIRSHVEALSKKSYERLREVNTLDFIFMFMPIEGALAVALEHDSSIYDKAFKKKILLVGPTTLLVAMRAVENVWKHERQNQNAKEIARRAGAMVDKFVGFSEDMLKISKQFDILQNNFHTAQNKLSTGKGNLVRQALKLQELGAQTSKEIPKALSEV